jgi:hypothetical protein
MNAALRFIVRTAIAAGFESFGVRDIRQMDERGRIMRLSWSPRPLGSAPVLADRLAKADVGFALRTTTLGHVQ